VLVIRGEAGIGKTALMQYCARQASGCRVAQIAGVESELELPFAAVHQLCDPMLDHLDALPAPQQQALRVVFGLEAGNAPDLFVVGLAVLGLLSEVAAERPLVCLVDDAQWLDEPSRQVMGFVGRRLLADAVFLLLAVREAGDEQLFPALPSLTLEGLTDEDARALLVAAVPGSARRPGSRPDRGRNPREPAEAPRAAPGDEPGGARRRLRPASHQWAYGGALHAAHTSAIRTHAAAAPSGGSRPYGRRNAPLACSRDDWHSAHAAAAAESEQLIAIGSHVRFRHPLVRAAAYAAGTTAIVARRIRRSRRRPMTAVDPERRVWHLAAAATGPDEGSRDAARAGGRLRPVIAPGWRRRLRSSSVRCS
jgi:hypothetical protein